jgi:diguanylate cyclase (GGDEF)-like protein
MQWWNERCEMNFQDMLEHGAFSDWKIDPGQHLAEMLETVLSGRVHEAEIEQGERIIRTHNRLMTPDFILSTQEDVTARVLAERQVTYLALHDPLTGLLNRAGFVSGLKEMIKCKARDEQSFGIVSLDLDHFKDVNDLYGHMAGDAVLQATGARITAALGPEDFSGRLGGDEFILVIGSDQQPSRVNLIASRLQAELCQPVAFEGRALTVGASIGVALYPRDGTDRKTLISNADMALYRAKREGRGRACMFDPAMDEHARERRLGFDRREPADPLSPQTSSPVVERAQSM